MLPFYITSIFICLSFILAELIVLITSTTERKEGVKPILVKYYKDYVVFRPFKKLHIHISSVKKVICVLQVEISSDLFVITICNFAFLFKFN